MGAAEDCVPHPVRIPVSKHAASRQPYTPPVLEVHGSIVDLTRQIPGTSTPLPTPGSEIVGTFEDIESSSVTLDSSKL